MRLSSSNPMNRALAPLLVFEAIAFGLAIPGMLLVDKVVPALAWVSVGVTVVLAVAAAGTLRRGVGFVLGWVVQLAGVLLGLLTPMMFAVGGMFALIWVASFVLGRRLEPSPGAR